MRDASDADRGLTDRVLKSYSGIEEPRPRSLVLALIRHLYAYVEQTELTDEEWEFAWNFMGRMAAVSDRNEFLLLGDVLGVSQLIETLNHAFTLVIHLPAPSRYMPQRTRRGVLGAGAGGSPFLFLRRRFRIMSSTENPS
jgi:catechol 2,3-dioxygenase-like protein